MIRTQRECLSLPRPTQVPRSALTGLQIPCARGLHSATAVLQDAHLGNPSIVPTSGLAITGIQEQSCPARGDVVRRRFTSQARGQPELTVNLCVVTISSEGEQRLNTASDGRSRFAHFQSYRSKGANSQRPVVLRAKDRV